MADVTFRIVDFHGTRGEGAPDRYGLATFAPAFRRGLKAARISAENSSGCSHAAKCPPLSTSWK